jgi:ATP-binding protein involved in chromosome partitioning
VPDEPAPEATPPPAAIDVDRDLAITLRWADGSLDRYALEELRVNCPCAECRGRREQGRPVWPDSGSPRPLRVEHAELVGGWGLSITWNDGHSTGIYSWELLRAWRAAADGPDRAM